MLIIPAIDLRDGRCVRLTQGRKEDVKVYDGDAVEIAQRYQDNGARMLHIVDLDGAFSDPNSRNRQVLREIIRQVKIPAQFGGGLRSLQDIEQVIELGVTRVVIGTLAVESPETVEKGVLSFGGDRIAVGIDARSGQVLTRGWRKEGKIFALELAQRVAALGVERIVYTDIARDGMLMGPDIEQTCKITRESGLKVTASGGVSSLDDIKRFKSVSECGIDSVIVGKALYECRFTLREASQAGL
ncbi:MAG: 1-(5-phosphoribosyl)-5-[(5-phosphoribosylamino)methylideneamino]imidazole-4-carboxamide isomerase [Acidobacteriota bacterium]|nr:1-(5-phosphoribosyl)-5-[(5-phosphoribosylamino)methylideneamino]imidazole-4-carboxamide isomerase [Acidobacteriota bacterium]